MPSACYYQWPGLLEPDPAYLVAIGNGHGGPPGVEAMVASLAKRPVIWLPLDGHHKTCPT